MDSFFLAEETRRIFQLDQIGGKFLCEPKYCPHRKYHPHRINWADIPAHHVWQGMHVVPNETEFLLYVSPKYNKSISPYIITDTTEYMSIEDVATYTGRSIKYLKSLSQRSSRKEYRRGHLPDHFTLRSYWVMPGYRRYFRKDDINFIKKKF